MAIVRDMIDLATLSENADGFEAVRLFHVSDVSGNSDKKVFNALRMTGVPQFNQSHPADGSLRVVSRNASLVPNTTDTFRITCTYRRPTEAQQPPSSSQPAQLSIGTSLQEITTVYNRHGQLMFTVKTDADGREVSDSSGVPVYQLAESKIMVPLTVATFTRKESHSPLLASAAYCGKVNSVTFLGASRRKWMCTNIGGSSPDGGVTWDVSYEFTLNQDTWDGWLLYIDPATGQPLPNPIKGKSIVREEIAKEIDFRTLTLGAE